MSNWAFKQYLVAAARAATWPIPPSAAKVAYLQKTSFARVEGDEPEESIPASDFPFCFVSIPDMEEQRKTADPNGTGSIKIQTAPAHLFVYVQGFVADWKAINEYFDCLVDGTMAYFRTNVSPSTAQVTLSPNDHLLAAGLTVRSRIGKTTRTEQGLHKRATIEVHLLGSIV